MTNMQSYPFQSAQPLPLIRLSAINPFLVALKRRNAQPETLLADLNLPEHIPASADLFVSPNSIYEFVERAAELAGDRHLGFTIGQDLDLHNWEPIARAASEAQTVGELLQRFILNAEDHASSALFFLESVTTKTTFGFRRVVEPRRVPAQNDAFYLGFLYRLLIHAAQEHWDAREAVFSVADPNVIPPLKERLRIIEGGNSGASVRFPTQWLLEPFKKSTFARAIPSSTATHLPGSLLESMRLALTPHLHEPDLTVERAAEICGRERRKLSRSLREKGTTIAREVAMLRADKARQLLLSSDQRVSDVALSVGFGDPTVFSRAFKNWTGQSPQQFRRNNRP